MDYIRWWIKQADLFDTPLVPFAFVVSIFITCLLFNVNMILGILVGMLVAAIFGTIGYVVISDAFRTSYAKYLREKNKP